MSSSRRHRYWLVAAFALLMVLPQAWAAAALIAAAICMLVLAVAREAIKRRRPGAAQTGSGVLLGTDANGGRVVLSEHQLSAHALILGASGAGKTTTLLRILANHAARGRPVVAMDMKGSPAFARQLRTAATAAGRPFRVWSPDGPEHWNPLAHGNATELKDKLIATERFTEPHYQRAAERYVQTILQVIQRAHPDRPPSLEEVVGLMEPQRLPSVLRTLPSELSDRVQEYLAGLTPDQLSAVRGLGSRLAIITESHAGPYLRWPAEGGAVDLQLALTRREVVLFSLNSSTYGKLAAQLGTLAVQDLVSSVGHRLMAADRLGTLEQATIAIDEFSALGADHVISLLARGREAGASVMLATQELSDLDRAAPGLRDQILGNTAVKIAHRQDVPSSALLVAQMAGTEKAWEETEQLGGPLLGGYRTGRGTRRQVEQFVVHPNEIKSLETGEAVLITKLPVAHARIVRVAPPPGRPAELASVEAL